MRKSFVFGRNPRLTMRPSSGQTFLMGILNFLMIHLTTTSRIRASTIMITLIRIIAPM